MVRRDAALAVAGGILGGVTAFALWVAAVSRQLSRHHG